ncbi:hypothetical protein LMG29542_07252 [Paraburkholderia humisilvae]|uniref:Lipoprotein n=1 Tax=Paraburkholderia humisilvae TaxID=627669 RepID=A0A6J5F6T1_9BURK|nr:hypothetical protein LMG29542_07252 [Paraburkholderia humisilvae]
MRRSRIIALLLPLVLGGCLSFSSSDPRPPDHTTVVVPRDQAQSPPPAGMGCSYQTPC